jgi:hypothetical protein
MLRRTATFFIITPGAADMPLSDGVSRAAVAPAEILATRAHVTPRRLLTLFTVNRYSARYARAVYRPAMRAMPMIFEGTPALPFTPTRSGCHRFFATAPPCLAPILRQIRYYAAGCHLLTL